MKRSRPKSAESVWRASLNPRTLGSSAPRPRTATARVGAAGLSANSAPRGEQPSAPADDSATLLRVPTPPGEKYAEAVRTHEITRFLGVAARPARPG